MSTIDHRPLSPRVTTLQGIQEELANSITHGLGLLLSAAGFVALVVVAGLHGTIWHVIGCSVYGLSLVVLYSASTLYHTTRSARAKRILRLVDHAAIYLLIAGTYTPFTLICLSGPWGWTLFSIVWSLAVLGIAFKIVYGHRHEHLSLGIYLAMGWMCLIAARPIVAAVPTGGLILLVAGGLAYTAGTIFYAKDDSVKYFHAVWHLFVLLGSVLHFCAVFFYVLPAAR